MFAAGCEIGTIRPRMQYATTAVAEPELSGHNFFPLFSYKDYPCSVRLNVGIQAQTDSDLN